MKNLVLLLSFSFIFLFVIVFVGAQVIIGDSDRIFIRGVDISPEDEINSFPPQYIFAHTDQIINLDFVSVWKNITFFQEEVNIKKGIIHIFNDDTNSTFTITELGIYEINYNFNLADTSPGATDVNTAGRLLFFNGSEVIGSLFETDIIKQAVDIEIAHTFLSKFIPGDIVYFQFIADNVNVELSTHSSFGDHPNSASIVIKKVANI